MSKSFDLQRKVDQYDLQKDAAQLALLYLRL
jgi:hypothetical protein